MTDDPNNNSDPLAPAPATATTEMTDQASAAVVTGEPDPNAANLPSTAVTGEAAGNADASVGEEVSNLHEAIDSIGTDLTFELRKAKQLVDEALDWVKKHFERAAPGIDDAELNTTV